MPNDRTLKKVSSLSDLGENLTYSKGSFRIPIPGKIFIPLQPPNSDVRYSLGLEIVLLAKSKVVISHLLWKLIYKGGLVLEWWLLYEYLSRNIRSTDENYFACLCGVLKLSSATRKSVLDFQSHLRPIQKFLSEKRTIVDNVPYKNLLEFVHSELKLPKSGSSDNSLYRQAIRTIPFQKPPELNRIGVGYKDKGSMGPETLEGSGVLLNSPSDLDEKDFLRVWTSLVKTQFL